MGDPFGACHAVWPNIGAEGVAERAEPPLLTIRGRQGIREGHGYFFKVCLEGVREPPKRWLLRPYNYASVAGALRLSGQAPNLREES
jgi:hypothetical protein